MRAGHDLDRRMKMPCKETPKKSEYDNREGQCRLLHERREMTRKHRADIVVSGVGFQSAWAVGERSGSILQIRKKKKDCLP